VVVGKLSMFFHEQFRMELEGHRYAVTDIIDVFSVFYNTKATPNTERDFP
jgi:hypothetical protein